VKYLLSTTHKPTKGKLNSQITENQKVNGKGDFSDDNASAIEVILQKIKLYSNQ
jgi:hypothetical protein